MGWSNTLKSKKEDERPKITSNTHNYSPSMTHDKQKATTALRTQSLRSSERRKRPGLRDARLEWPSSKARKRVNISWNMAEHVARIVQTRSVIPVPTGGHIGRGYQPSRTPYRAFLCTPALFMARMDANGSSMWMWNVAFGVC